MALEKLIIMYPHSSMNEYECHATTWVKIGVYIYVHASNACKHMHMDVKSFIWFPMQYVHEMFLEECIKSC